MSSHAGIRMIALVSVLTLSATFAADGPPAWAYGFPQPGAPAAPAGGRGRGGQAAPDNSPKRLAGSNLEFTLTQIRDGFGPADWFPDGHPKMPEIVAHGRRPEVRACALCHYPNGKGAGHSASSTAQTPDFWAANQRAPGKPNSRDAADTGTGEVRSFTRAATFSAEPR